MEVVSSPLVGVSSCGQQVLQKQGRGARRVGDLCGATEPGRKSKGLEATRAFSQKREREDSLNEPELMPTPITKVRLSPCDRSGPTTPPVVCPSPAALWCKASGWCQASTVFSWPYPTWKGTNTATWCIQSRANLVAGLAWLSWRHTRGFVSATVSAAGLAPTGDQLTDSLALEEFAPGAPNRFHGTP